MSDPSQETPETPAAGTEPSPPASAVAPAEQAAPPAESAPAPAEKGGDGSAVRIGGLVAAGLISMILLMAWLAGAFSEKVEPRERGALPPAPAGLELHTVQVTEVPHVREVTGSIAAEHETVVSAELLGRVAEVRATPGEHVSAGRLLVRLDEAEHRARLEQAEAMLRQATDHYERTRKQHEAQTATTRQLVQAKTELEAAQAKFAETKTILAKTKIEATSAGVVIERLVEVGDTVTPGRPLVRIYDRLQLVAIVPESLQPHLAVGQEVDVSIDVLGPGACAGTVTEIVPEAQALARAFRVKVTGPCPPGLIPGMFGRMRVPLGTRRELRIPQAAVRRVGQIHMVYKRLPDGGLLRQFVQVGERVGDEWVITSGLAAGEQVAADAGQVVRGTGER